MIDDDDNAYRPPKAKIEVPEQTPEVRLQRPRRCPFSAGSYWIKDAWHLFKLRPWLLIGMWVIFFLIMAVLSMLPFISIFSSIITPVFIAGFVFSAAKIEQHKSVALEDLFIGFSRNSGELLGIGGLSLIFSFFAILVAILVAILLAALILDVNIIEGVLSNASGEEFFSEYLSDERAGIFLLLVGLIYLALQLPFVMLTWFAPVLIIQHDLNIWQAMTLSFLGCLRNILPFLLYSLIFLLLSVAAMTPLFLGFLIVAPLFMVTFYTAYKDIFLYAGKYEVSFVA